MHWKATRRLAERKQLIGGWRNLTGSCRTDDTSRGTGHKRVQRFPAGGYSSRLGGCSEVTRLVGLTLLHALSTAIIIDTAAGRIPLSVPLIPKSLFHSAQSRRHRRDRPKRSGGPSWTRRCYATRQPAVPPRRTRPHRAASRSDPSMGQASRGRRLTRGPLTGSDRASWGARFAKCVVRQGLSR